MIKGIFFDGQTSTKKTGVLHYDEHGYISFTDLGIEKIHIDLIKISTRLANTPRYLNFPDGSLFETSDNDSVDAMVQTFKPSFYNGMLHNLESAKTVVIASIAIVVLSGWLLIKYGIPYFSTEIAAMVPAEASQYMGQGVLDIMDKNWFKKTELSADRQAELRLLFKSLIRDIDGSEHYKLEFRQGGIIRANAFALPNGTIVFTDELIKLATNNKEIASIMLHEAGHLKHRHSLRSTVQQFSLAMFVMVVSGDVSTSSSIITAIPLMLVESGFSQKMESEADTFSLDYMLKHNISPKYFVSMMEKLEASYSEAYNKCLKESVKDVDRNKCIEKSIVVNKSSDETKKIIDYFSTHPNIKERIKRFREAS